METAGDVARDVPDSARTGDSAAEALTPARGSAERRRVPWRRWAEIALLAGPGVVVFVTFVIVPVLMAGYYGFFRWSGYGVPTEVVVAIGFSLMLHPTGAVNDVLHRIGLGGLATDWLSDPDVAIWTLMLILVWKYIGFAVILMLAGLQGIPDELREAAAIDGASYWQTQWHITLPLLGPTIRIWAFLSIIGSLQVFDLVYVIWGQYVSNTAGTSTMATYMVANGRISGEYGYGSAVAVVIFVVSLVIALVYQRFVLRRDTEGALTEGVA